MVLARVAARAFAVLACSLLEIGVALLVIPPVSAAPGSVLRDERNLHAYANSPRRASSDRAALQASFTGATGERTVAAPAHSKGSPTLAQVSPAGVPEWGCSAALAYIAAHGAPGFVASCPHYAGGHQAITECVGPPECEPGTDFIWIADACPAAYMNEASNSWVLIGESSAPLDPYGYCGEPGNPYG